jgi:hypothetical protein
MIWSDVNRYGVLVQELPILKTTSKHFRTGVLRCICGAGDHYRDWADWDDSDHSEDWDDSKIFETYYFAFPHCPCCRGTIS